MKRFIPVILVLALAAAPSCFLKKDKPAVPSDGVARKYSSKPVKNPVPVLLSKGLQYTIISNGNGPAVKNGDRVSMLYTGKLTNDTIFDATSRRGNTPFKFKVGGRQVIAGWDSIVSRLHGGDKAIMRIPAEYGYGARANGSIPANSTLVFEVEVLDITGPPVQWDAKGKDTITTPSGLKIVMFKSYPDSAKPATGKNVMVHYSGYNMDGSMFDSSVERDQPFTFSLGRGQVIKGWDEGIGMLREGEKAKLIIPYNLAYGESGRPPMIPPRATLIFDVELISFK
ncbi:MAG: FKBP-type peptidyl-prolyl cis-trans isomerase [Bacteroidota bacterium]|nr:FKBP-type peptidyl-prolyl cis-trans isomerase [Bacteroidota bacterium]